MKKRSHTRITPKNTAQAQTIDSQVGNHRKNWNIQQIKQRAAKNRTASND